ncbi:hypothetical protein TrispH2_011951, partial [Trichoplax sp. H2]
LNNYIRHIASKIGADWTRLARELDPEIPKNSTNATTDKLDKALLEISRKDIVGTKNIPKAEPILRINRLSSIIVLAIFVVGLYCIARNRPSTRA